MYKLVHLGTGVFNILSFKILATDICAEFYFLKAFHVGHQGQEHLDRGIYVGAFELWIAGQGY